MSESDHSLRTAAYAVGEGERHLVAGVGLVAQLQPGAARFDRRKRVAEPFRFFDDESKATQQPKQLTLALAIVFPCSFILPGHAPRLAPERASEKPSFPTGKCARRAHFSTSIQLKGHIFRVRLPVLRVFRLCSAGNYISRRWTAGRSRRPPEEWQARRPSAVPTARACPTRFDKRIRQVRGPRPRHAGDDAHVTASRSSHRRTRSPQAWPAQGSIFR